MKGCELGHTAQSAIESRRTNHIGPDAAIEEGNEFWR